MHPDIKYTNPVKDIHVYDNVFTLRQADGLQQDCANSMFKLGWYDTNKAGRESFVHSQWTVDDLLSSNVLDYLQEAGVVPHFNVDDLIHTMVNVDTIADSHWTHCHHDQKVILIYVDTEWKDEWGGETLFFDHRTKDIMFGSRYTPNRVICFDGETPHKIIPPSPQFPHKFRMTLAICYWKEGKNPNTQCVPGEDVHSASGMSLSSNRATTEDCNTPVNTI